MIKNLISVLIICLTALILSAMFAPKKQVQVIYEVKKDLAFTLAHNIVPYISDGREGRSATGFYLRYAGKSYIVTNRHVCDHSQIRTKNSGYVQFAQYMAKIIAIDEYHDLCLLTSNRISGLSLASRQSLNMEKVFMIGFPRGIGKVIREGRIIEEKTIYTSWLLPQKRSVSTYHISVSSYPGNSGSPVFNEEGKVTGVLFAGSPVYPLEGYIVPLRYLKAFIQESVLGLPRHTYEQ